MDIDPPRQPGDYTERAEDCIEAIEPAFLELVENARTNFVDVLKITVALTVDGVAAGWRCHEIAEAVHRLATDHQERLGNIQKQIAQTFYADGGSSVH